MIGRKRKYGKTKKDKKKNKIMKKDLPHIEKSITFATSNVYLRQSIDNKPFRRAFGSILEGRFPFYKAEIRNALRSKFGICHTVCDEFATQCVAILNARVQNFNIKLKQKHL